MQRFAAGAYLPSSSVFSSPRTAQTIEPSTAWAALASPSANTKYSFLRLSGLWRALQPTLGLNCVVRSRPNEHSQRAGPDSDADFSLRKGKTRVGSSEFRIRGVELCHGTYNRSTDKSEKWGVLKNKTWFLSKQTLLFFITEDIVYRGLSKRITTEKIVLRHCQGRPHHMRSIEYSSALSVLAIFRYLDGIF